MANHKSAAKRAKQSEARRIRNKTTRSSMKTAVKKAQGAAVDSSDTKEDLLRSAQSLIAKAVKKGVIHKNTGARKVSKLTKQINSAA